MNAFKSSKQNLVAIITARGGSKGLPKKNIKLLNGKPLINYTIEAALNSGLFNQVVVTTDDLEIKKISLQYDVTVIDRPAILATDKASSIDVIEHALNYLIRENKNNSPDYFFLLQPTSPLRKFKHIINAWDIFIKEKAVSLVSITEEKNTPFKLLVKNDDKYEPLFNYEMLTKPRQELPKSYAINGAIYIVEVNQFMRSKNIFSAPMSVYEMPLKDSIDIDTEEDFRQVELILKKD